MDEIYNELFNKGKKPKYIIRRSGPATVPYNIYEFLRGKEDFSNLIQSIMTPALGLKPVLS